VVILMLAFAIGLNTAVFSLVNTVLLRPRPGAGVPGEMVGLFCYDTTRPDSYRDFSYPAYRDIREQNQVFTDLTAAGAGMVGLGEGELTRRVFAYLIGANYFSAFGVQPAMGRGFLAEEEAPESMRQVVILSDDYWRKMGANPGVLGTSLRINTVDFTVVGVAPRGFAGPSALVSPAVYLPLGIYENIAGDLFRQGGHTKLADRANTALLLFGRLKAGTSLESAAIPLKQLATRLEQAYPGEHKNFGLSVHRLSRTGFGTSPQDDGDTAAMSALLMGTAALVLVIACMNIANMLLARATARRREFAIRLAVGASRTQVIRQLLIEGFVLSVAGSLAGLVLAYWAIRFLTATIDPMLPVLLVVDPRPDIRVLGASLGLATLATLAFSLGPALSLARTDVVTEIKEGERSGPQGGRRFGFRHVLVVIQLALALALLTAAGLFVRGAINASHAEPGFSLDRSLLVTLDPSLAGVQEAQGRLFYGRVLERVRALPDVQAASMASVVPFGDFTEGRSLQRVGTGLPSGESPSQDGEGSVSYGTGSGAPRDTHDGIGASYYIVGRDYFEALGVPILRGRGFTELEERSPSGPRVTIIDEPLAKRLFPDGDPLGQRVYFPSRDATEAAPMEVVGIVGGTRHSLFDRQPVPHVFVPFGQRFRAAMSVHIRVASAAAEAAVLRTARQEIRAINDRVPIVTMSTMREFRDRSLSSWSVRTGAKLFSVFGGLAVILAVIGVYAVRAYLVGRRTREIGVRIALGATERRILWMVLGEGGVLVAVGLGVGLLLSIGTGLVLSSTLYEVSPFDPWVFSIAPLALALTALMACYFPARRAAGLAPSAALRAD
jgi:predicted permease